MRFSDDKKQLLQREVSMIFLEMVGEAQQRLKQGVTPEQLATELADSEKLASMVFSANEKNGWVRSSKGYFLLGMLCQQIEDYGPKILDQFMKAVKK